ncbi:MAG: cyclopropane-fatty-acyl-phospholipid synthase family protein [Hyphomonadaceae bacterium]
MRKIQALAPARIKWAIELLGIEKDHNVFEIGCGSGVAAQRICPLLGYGTYMGVDKSAAAIKAARERNAAYAKAGRAMFMQESFTAEAHEPALFDRILAVNVNAFWASEGDELRDVCRMMHNKSVFVQVYEPPAAEQRAKIARVLKQRMAPYLANVTTSMRTVAGAPLLAVVATGERAKKAA